VEPILGIGFIIHILYATILTLQNQQARPEKYAVRNASNSSGWASRNMYILGATILAFLVLHLANFYFKIKFGHPESVIVDGVEMHDTYTMVISKFQIGWYAIIYIAGAILLGLHLSHGFWSSFQSLGLSNAIWRKRLSGIGLIYAIIIGVGFSILPLYFLIIS
jgi:succinate dehydrogenase / fumarate reductase cytochrome b subunit